MIAAFRRQGRPPARAPRGAERGRQEGPGAGTHVRLKTPPRALPSRRQSCCEKRTQEISGSELRVWQRRPSRKAGRFPRYRSFRGPLSSVADKIESGCVDILFSVLKTWLYIPSSVTGHIPKNFRDRLRLPFKREFLQYQTDSVHSYPLKLEMTRSVRGEVTLL